MGIIKSMKIGIFDSGVGGLIMTRAIVDTLPKYDYIYLGDTKRVPYGPRSQKEVFQFLKEGVQYLFEKECTLIIVACNTASARALRKVQQTYLPKYFPDRRVLGVIIPTAEEVSTAKRIGIIATAGTVKSGTYALEIQKLNPPAVIFQQAAPLLVEYIEKGDMKRAEKALETYLKPLIAKKIDTLILGCTHYPIVKNVARKIIGPHVRVISQDECIPQKTAEYLNRHPEIETMLSKKRHRSICLTKETKTIDVLAARWFGKKIKIEKVKI